MHKSFVRNCLKEKKKLNTGNEKLKYFHNTSCK